MAMPAYDKLLEQYKMEGSALEQTVSDAHLMELVSIVDRWEMLAKFLIVPNTEIESIKSDGDVEEQRIRVLKCWQQKCGSAATYKVLVKALLQINRTDLAKEVVALRLSSIDAHASATMNSRTQPSPNESSLVMTHSLASNSGAEDISPYSVLATLSVHMAQQEDVTSNLRELEKEFYELVRFVETILDHSEVHINTITRQFSMLPQSIRRQHQTDENYTATRLKLTSIKQIFDNLTELKHWSYMTPHTLACILQDVKSNEVHQKVEEYKRKLIAFKSKTKLRDVIGLSFPVPDYCIELTMEVEGWEDKTIEEAEKAAMNILYRATNSSQNIHIAWKRVLPGNIKLMFTLMEPINVSAHSKEKLLEVCKDNGVVSIQVDGDDLCSNDILKVNIKLHSQCMYQSVP